MRKITIRLNEVMQKRGLTQVMLADMTGIRQAAISEMANNMRKQINLPTLIKIADALEIDDISELMTIEHV